MFVAAVGGGGSDSGILQEFERTRDSCLAGRTRKDSRTHRVFILPVCLAPRHRQASGEDQGKEDTVLPQVLGESYTPVTSPHICITHLSVRAFSFKPALGG